MSTKCGKSQTVVFFISFFFFFFQFQSFYRGILLLRIGKRKDSIPGLYVVQILEI